MTTPTDDRFYTELLKLLLHVAWSDDELDPNEARALLSAAQRWKLPVPELQRLERCLELGEPLPAPNLGLLRQHPDEVLSTVRTLIESDANVHLSEEEMLAQIRELLGLPPA
ncbi:TerB family tellurite resistance protein [Vitiosangium sp. GDMCC 1.1324]|uniref:tellurite resistance TerB family protein n=1 Tax=Vitiosangium sp. (strain GDMCC 1.1324) TaxID=2138576 RepID=UPI000D33C79F|nr:TerB family tellurite resistance protein [Vitiosangium sp. GDMCC 1.1324]PTL76684.1 TerB family tellurite resistance protein [Vitiosangium sp. GDMCC 1.1324]